MPLSKREQKVLDEMERNLYHGETDRVAMVGDGLTKPNYRSIVVGVLVVLVGAGLLVGGVTVQQPIVGIAGFVAMLAGVLVTTRGQRTNEKVDVGPSADADGNAGRRSMEAQ